MKETNKYIKFFILGAIISMLTFVACSDGSFKSGNEDGVGDDNSHPRLLLSAKSAANIQSQLGQNELLDQSFDRVKQNVDLALETGISVPVPKDPGGGYTHELHKKNGILIYEAGLLFRITQEKKYLTFVDDMLLEYAKLYPTIDLHPKRKTNKQSPGKLFWQGLNDCMWVVYAIQGYDLVYDDLSEEDRAIIENGVFLPMASFLSEGSAFTFNRIHNHGTWAVAAVGMTGYVLGNDDLVEKSLHGLDKDDKGGFLAQLDKLFSPDGYYTEGPYYQRFAMMPFIVFAEAIQQNNPDIQIYAYNDSILDKATNTALQLTYTNGAFFPLNDGLKEKTFETVEMVYAANIAYASLGKNPGLLDVAQMQGRVSLTNAGLKAAADWKAGKTEPFKWHSMFLSDGAAGDEGGVGILRSGPNDDQSCLLMKYTSHGLAHGHYDKLGFLYYDNNTEIIRDYGAARFLNIEAKYGGRYLPENYSWGKTSIAHNTLTVDEICQFEGDFKTSSVNHPTAVLFSSENDELKYMSAYDDDAYPGVEMYRTMVLAEIPSLEHPVIIDVFQVESDESHQYDLPFYYNGHLMECDFETNIYTDQLKPLGSKDGYQHLWKKGTGKSNTGNAQFTWLINNRFYTLSMLTDANTEMIFATIGANDPNFNLRNESAIILRQKNTANHLFVNIIEPHGEFNPIAEYTKSSSSAILSLSATATGANNIEVNLILKNGETWQMILPATTKDSSKQQITFKQIK